VHLPHRIHLMAGRVPQGADRAAVRGEMETVFLENLKYAAGVLAQVRGRNVGDQLRHETGHWLMPEGQMSMLVSDWLMGDKCGSSVHCIQHGARRTSWECWNPLTPGSRTPSTSWIHPSRVGPWPCACLLIPLDSCAPFESHVLFPGFSQLQPFYRRLEDPTSNCKW
jgi:hypothetical protein